MDPGNTFFQAIKIFHHPINGNAAFIDTQPGVCLSPQGFDPPYHSGQIDRGKIGLRGAVEKNGTAQLRLVRVR
jgi:hypothetical protein